MPAFSLPWWRVGVDAHAFVLGPALAERRLELRLPNPNTSRDITGLVRTAEASHSRHHFKWEGCGAAAGGGVS